ncbi:PiggyBac transposable element-derived protein [Trinorchestia longiramus]|nr:PiggyBac transposable element-derived protein [Trinorchestia longiramus]
MDPKRKDELYKIRPLLDHLNKAFLQKRTMAEHLWIDESMIRFTGRSTLKQYNPMKPIECGCRLWCLADYQGYLYKANIYTEADQENRITLFEYYREVGRGLLTFQWANPGPVKRKTVAYSTPASVRLGNVGIHMSLFTGNNNRCEWLSHPSTRHSFFVSCPATSGLVTPQALLGKLRLWIRRLEKGVIAQFHTLDQFIENSHDTGSLPQTTNKEMNDHLKGLETSMHHYFPESDQETASLQWIIHPFSVPDEAIHDDDFPAKEEWITMRANEALKIELQNQNADSFWISQLADSPTLSKRALKLLVSFSTPYLCEKGFSTVLGMKTKKRTRLNFANDARLALSTTKPRIPQLASNMQLQPSH